MPFYNFMNVMFGIGDAAHHHSGYDWFLGVRCYDVECPYHICLLILLSMSF